MTGIKPSVPGRPRIVTCPRCSGDSVYASSNRFRPFCSERCKIADLGAWAAEDYRLAAQPRLNDGAHGDGDEIVE